MKFTEEQIKGEQIRRDNLAKEYLSSKEYVETLIKRLEINDACERTVEAKALTWKLCERVDDPAEGCIFFIENFLWTFNPKQEPKHFPFILFDFQKQAVRETVNHILNGRDLFIEKSREMGVSWLVFCAIMLWFWIFQDGFNALLGSYKEDLVDNKTQDSLFGKIDYQLYQLPKWLMPKDFKPLKHRTHMKLINPANGNLITGDTMNPNFGRGSRKTVIAFDELGFWQYAKDAWESAGDSTNCRIANSTPNGYNYYAMLRESGIDILSLHWKSHPLKDDEWYKYECGRRTEEEIAQELDISYSKSKAGRVYPEWNEDNVETGYFEYNDSLPLYVGWDFGRSDDTAIIWGQRVGNKFRIIDVYRNNGKNIDFYVPFVTGIVPGDNQYHYNEKDLDIIFSHRNYKPATHFGDPAGRFHNNVSDETVFSILRKHNIIVNFKDSWKEFNVRKSATKRLIMDGIELNHNDRTKYFNMCIIQSSYPEVKVDGVGQVRSTSPKHDSSSHYRSSLEYLALGLEDWLSRDHLKPYDKFKKKDETRSKWGSRRSMRY
jgi:hypothetical protein